MDFNFAEILATIIPQLGFGAVFLWLYIQEKKDSRSDVAQKDERIRELSQELAELTSKNIEVMTQFKDAVTSNTAAMQVNNNSIQSLSEKITILIAGGIPQR